MTAQTPVYGLKYIVEGEPVRNARAALEDNAKTIEAALILGGIAPPSAQDLATLSGRVTALETPLAWTYPTLNTGYANLGVNYVPARYRHYPALDGVLVQFTLDIGAPAGIIFTIPAGPLRPQYNQVLTSTHGATGTIQVTVSANGNVELSATATSFVAVTEFYLLD